MEGITKKDIAGLKDYRNPIIDNCCRMDVKDEKLIYCDKVTDEKVGVDIFCKVFAMPSAKWRNGICPMATHLIIEKEKVEKVRVGQQKQKKKK